MMRFPRIWPGAAILAVLTIALPAIAQQPAPPPPVLEKLEEGEAPAITIRKQDAEKKTTEKRDNGGKVTEVKVQSGGSTYYLKPNDQAGSAVPGDAQSSSMRAAQWPILEFDLGGKKTPKEVDATQTPAPPAAPEPAKK